MAAPTHAVFQVASRFYGWMTAQRTWREHCRKLVSEMPRQPSSPPLRIVDLGCGPGVSTFAIADERSPHGDTVLGLDFALGMLRDAQRRAPGVGLRGSTRIGWIGGDAARLPFADASIDVLTGHSFLYLLPDRAGALREALRVLKRGGSLILMEPNRTPSLGAALSVGRDPRFLLSMVLWRPFSRFYGRFSRQTLAETLSEAGFTGARVEETLGGMGLLARAVRPMA